MGSILSGRKRLTHGTVRRIYERWLPGVRGGRLLYAAMRVNNGGRREAAGILGYASVDKSTPPTRFVLAATERKHLAHVPRLFGKQLQNLADYEQSLTPEGGVFPLPWVPEDEASFLILADWLDEHDQPYAERLARFCRDLVTPPPADWDDKKREFHKMVKEYHTRMWELTALARKEHAEWLEHQKALGNVNPPYSGQHLYVPKWDELHAKHVVPHLQEWYPRIQQFLLVTVPALATLNNDKETQ